MSKQEATEKPLASVISADTGETRVCTPSLTPSGSPQRSSDITFTSSRDLQTQEKMDENAKIQPAEEPEKPEQDAAAANKTDAGSVKEGKKSKEPKKKNKCTKHEHRSHKRKSKSSTAKARKDESDSDSSSDESEESDCSSDSSDCATSKRKKISKSKAMKKRRKSKSKADDSSDTSESEDSEDESSASSSSEDDYKSRKHSKKSKKRSNGKKSRRTSTAAVQIEPPLPPTESDDAGCDAAFKTLEISLATVKRCLSNKLEPTSPTSPPSPPVSSSKSTKSKSKSSRKGSVYKRVDEIWDSTIHDFKLKESTEKDESEYSEYAFLVRRTFDNYAGSNKYLYTVVDIKHQQLRAALLEIMKGCKSISLEAKEPVLDPNTLFLYLEEMRKYYQKTVKNEIKKEKKRKAIKKLEERRKLVKALVKYIDKDYEKTKKTLYPLLEAGNITFDLLWALFHPNDIAITSCYGVWDEPRCFKVEYASKCASLSRGEWYCIEGKYLEYDGKHFGFGEFEVDIDKFQGPRKITSLATYPLKYHKDPDKVKKQIRDRGEKFVSMDAMHYQFHKGLSFMKKKRQVLKININGRIMVDPATFRRINPNYPISFIKPRQDDELFSIDNDDSDSENGCCCGDDSDDEADGSNEIKNKFGDNHKPKYKYKWADDGEGHEILMPVEVDENGDPIQKQGVEALADNLDLRRRTFTEEELLLTSPVMLGFSFSDKLWLEFTISGVRDIDWNEKAFESLVLPPNQKSIVRALVESHKSHSAKTIDDVVQGKGKGLVGLLHGPPGVGKTLTAEGISELLKCPLYMVSAGELGTQADHLEQELQKILDIAHSWGAVLLLDEADVFLEKREVHDIHRNALVSIFLRLLEYFQGILFLTTNRVETFDEAFQSRIHVALRYGELNHKAKKTVWKMFIDMVRDKDNTEIGEFKDSHFESLARNQLNGRQIKNLVRTAQALALNEKKKLTMDHITRVLDVAETFDKDLKGGTGYLDAMRSYT